MRYLQTSMNVRLDLVAMEERVKTFQEATDANASQDFLATTVKSVRIVHTYVCFHFLSFLVPRCACKLFHCRSK